ncbi:MAG: Rpn family recombination-promoting nuclease/putative transposase [Ruminococcus sp.]|jgi:predicted transposase/invertase (TIGR01784 family)|nr:Rpn family recombination-promoting nuclease/putative transposase [Ruminococcus sp.]
MELVCKPKLDVVFKAIFTENPDLLADFVGLALETEIEDLQILNNDILPESYNEKFSRLDILVKTKGGEKINVELQNSNKGNFKERSVFYCSKLYTSDLQSGKDYSEIAKTVCINILQFNLFDSENYRSTVLPIIKETGETLTDRWKIIFFETPKFPEDIESLKVTKNRLGYWLTFFSVGTEEALVNVDNLNDKEIKKAVSVVRHMNADERMREIARNREDAWLAEKLSLAEAKKEGITTGIELGEQNTMLRVAKNMLTERIAIDVIEKVTGLTQNELLSL